MASFWSVDFHYLAVLSSKLGSSFKASYEYYLESYPDISHQNMFAYNFRTYYMSFVKNEHIKLDETCIDTQGHFKANL